LTVLKIQLMPARISDLGQVLAIENASFPFPWTKEMFLNELQDPSFSASFVAREAEGERVLGYVFMKVLYDELHLLNLAVDPVWRRRGIGETLLRRTLSFLGEMRMDKVFLEVRVSNRPALDLYRKFGFKEIGLRRNYYCRPTEHALLLQYGTDAKQVLEAKMTN